MARAWSKPRTLGDWAAVALGLIFVLAGVPLFVGGAQLIALGGSWYYFPAGVALIVSGVLLALRHSLGAAIYGALFIATLIWALWEVGLDGWALVPRLAAWSVLLLLVIGALPALRPARSSRRLVTASVAGFAVLAIAISAGVAVTESTSTTAAVPPPSSAATRGATPQTGTDWPVYGADERAQRYAPLTQITRSNVARLARVWEYRTGDLPEQAWGAETTPLKIGDTVFLCSARNILIALDAGSGLERWRYDPHVSGDAIPYTAACRGVAYYAAAAAPAAAVTACAERIIEGTLDARLIAVDARTGQPCADFGVQGAVDLSQGLGETVPGMVSVTSPPTIVRGVVVTGHQVLDGQRRDAPSGVIRGFDAVTGELRWAWDLGRPDLTGAPPDGEIYTRGTPNVWTSTTSDEALGLVYLPLGNSAVDYLSSTRSAAENRYATSLVALDVETGRLAWSFQTVHVDVWDYDLGSQGTLVDFPTPAGPVPAIIVPSKQGDLYVLDRRTGEPLTGVEERAVPRGGVEPKERSATQPFSLYHTLAKPDLREPDMWGMSPIDQMICRIQFHRSAYEGIYTPPTADRRWIQYPGYNGGSDWGGVAVDPERGVIIANYNDMPNHNRLVPREVANRRGWFPRGDPRAPAEEPEDAGSPQLGAPYAIHVNAGWRMPYTGLLCKQPPYGGIRAIDLASGRTIWDRPLGTARRNGPFGIPSMLPFDIGTPNNGGAVITAGGLIFIAAATDNLIRALDIETGETLWQDVLPAGGQATPMAYAIDGREYIVIVAAGHHFMETPAGDYVIAYSLPATQ